MRILIVLLVTSLAVFPAKNRSNCDRAGIGETTHWGNSEVIVKENKIFKSIRGIVQRPDGMPMSDALVEVYDRPEGLLLDWRERKKRDKRQRRMTACKTSGDGRFSFAALPAGKYELRVSKPTEMCCGWNTTRVYLILNPRKPGRTHGALEVLMHLSI